MADRLGNSYVEFGSWMATAPGAGSGAAMLDGTTVRKLVLAVGAIS